METKLTAAEEKRSHLPGGIVAGIALVLIGVVSLVSRLVILPGTSVLLVMGLIFLAWGLITRKTGLIIPGSILCGIFAGAVLIEGPLTGQTDPVRGGVFLIAFACSWVLISLLSVYTEGPRNWWSWPLYPGTILGLVAVSLLAGEAGLKVLEVAGYIWPVILIVLGALLVFRRRF